MKAKNFALKLLNKNLIIKRNKQMKQLKWNPEYFYHFRYRNKQFHLYSNVSGLYFWKIKLRAETNGLE